MSKNLQLVCPNCQTINRVADTRLQEEPHCGKCKTVLLDGRVRELTTADFAKYIGKNELPVVVNFGASWCGHCRNFEPVFAQAAQKLKFQASLFRVESEEEPELVRRYGIKGMPTHIIFKGDKEVARQSGAMQLPLFMQWLTPHL
ncbi:thioredoxin TrxC [bacterium]|nr:thioredoxin TrxC [bacterium]